MELYCRLFSLLGTHQTTYLLFLNLKLLILRDLDNLESQYRALGYGRTVPGRKDTLHVIFTTNLYSSLPRSHKPPTALLALYHTIENGSRDRILGITPP